MLNYYTRNVLDRMLSNLSNNVLHNNDNFFFFIMNIDFARIAATPSVNILVRCVMLSRDHILYIGSAISFGKTFQ